VAQTDQFNQGGTWPIGKVCFPGFTRWMCPSCQGVRPTAMPRSDAEWPGSGILLRSEVTTLGLHIAHLPGVAAGQLGKAGGHFGPAILVQWLSRWGDVTARQEKTWIKLGIQIHMTQSRGPGETSSSGYRGTGQLPPSSNWTVQLGATGTSHCYEVALLKAMAGLDQA
jgi:hypothetical protein